VDAGTHVIQVRLAERTPARQEVTAVAGGEMNVELKISGNCAQGAGLGGATCGVNGTSEPDALGGIVAGALTSTGYTSPSGLTALDGTPLAPERNDYVSG